jgi:hypothetical protein
MGFDYKDSSTAGGDNTEGAFTDRCLHAIVAVLSPAWPRIEAEQGSINL